MVYWGNIGIEKKVNSNLLFYFEGGNVWSGLTSGLSLSRFSRFSYRLTAKNEKR